MHVVRALLSTCLLAGLAAGQDREIDAVAQALLDSHLPARDDPDARVAALIEVASAASASATSSLLIAEARRLISTLREPDRYVEMLSRYLDTGPHGLGEYEAKASKAEVLWRSGRHDDALAVRANDDYAATWLVIGPFGDGGDHYAGVVFPPEMRFPAAGAELSGRYGAIESRIVTRKARQRHIDPRPRDTAHTGCFYALHQVVADADTAGYAAVLCPGSFELFVNGERTATVDRYTARRPMLLRFGITLRKGHNHVMVKTTLNGYHDVGMRLHDAAGRRLPGVREYDGVPAVRPPAVPATDHATPGPFPDGVQLLARSATAAEGERRQRLILAAALTAIRTGNQDLGLELLQELDRDPPEDGLLAIANAELLMRATALPLEIRQGRARRLLEANAEALADHHHVALLRVGFLADQDKREDAVRVLQARVDADTAGPETFDRLNRLLVDLEFEAEARRNRARWREVVPNDPRPLMAAAAERAKGGDTRGALTMLTDALAGLTIDTVRRRALELARGLGEAELALRLLDELHLEDPDSPQALEDRAVTLRTLGEATKAAALDTQLAVHADANASQIRRAGVQLLRSGRTAEADTAFSRSLDLDADQHDLRRLRTRLRGEDDYGELAQFRRDGDAIIAVYEPTEREQGATSTLLLDQLIVLVLEDGSTVEETHLIRRINDLAGVERYQTAEAAAAADELILLRTIGTDGRSYVPQQVAGTFGMPRLEPAAFIEEIHRSYKNSPGAAPWEGPEFHFRSASEPYIASELVLILPPRHPGEIRTRNYPDAAEVVDLPGGWKAHVFRQTDVDLLPTERRAPPEADVVPVVTFGEDRDVDAAARGFAADALGRAYVTPVVEAATAEVIAGCAGDLAKLEAIHRFVHETIATDRGTPDPTATLMRRRGPRFFLEVAMLQIAGVPFRHAAVAAVREELRTGASPFFLGSERYEVPSARVEPRDAEPLWLFAGTPRHAPLGLVPGNRMGAPALLLQAPGAEHTRLPGGRPETQLGARVLATVTLGQEGGGTMEADALLRGQGGLAAAEEVRNLEGNVQKVVARQIAGQIFEGWTLSEVSLTNLDHNGEPLGVRAVLTRGRALEPAGEVSLLGLPMGKSQFLARLGDREERVLPLRLTEMASSSWEITVDPGDHYRFLEVPETIRLRHMLMEFALTYRLDGGRMVIRREVVQRPGVIPPSQFGEWRGLLRRLDLAEETNLRLMKINQ